jgi:hypothetical protein
MIHSADANANGTPALRGASAGIPDGPQIMREYFVVGGVYQDHQGNEHFSLVSPDRDKPPLLMIDGVRRYFGALSKYAHLYRVEADYSLSLVAPSTQALEWGIKAPEKVVLDREVLEKLKAVMN